jgi:serine-type D-Ala-D-Ala carboxypeptidase (penicillin-binding protein 5/6)
MMFASRLFLTLLSLFLLAALPLSALAGATEEKPQPAAAAEATPAPGPTPVVLGGKVTLPPDVPPAPVLADATSYVLMDDATGTVIVAKAPHEHHAPASLTKLMTLYLTYQALQSGTLKLDQTVPISTAAWKSGGSRMFVEPGMPVTTEQLIAGLMIDSGNDAAVALAEAVAGTQPSFVAMMNNAVKLLHLDDTHYANVNGLPASDLYTSALDVALLSRAILETHPEILKVSVQQYYTYNKIKQRNWNPVIFRDKTVDGLKTGLTDASGHCIDATALRDGRRLIAVVMGTPSWKTGTDDIEALLDYGYRFFANRTVAKAGEPVGTIEDPLRNPTKLPVGVAKTIIVTLPSGSGVTLTKSLDVADGLKGPIAKGDVVAHLAIALDGKPLQTVPAVALIATQPAGLGQRLLYKIKHMW